MRGWAERGKASWHPASSLQQGFPSLERHQHRHPRHGCPLLQHPKAILTSPTSTKDFQLLFAPFSLKTATFKQFPETTRPLRQHNSGCSGHGRHRRRPRASGGRGSLAAKPEHPPGSSPHRQAEPNRGSLWPGAVSGPSGWPLPSKHHRGGDALPAAPRLGHVEPRFEATGRKTQLRLPPRRRPGHFFLFLRCQWEPLPNPGHYQPLKQQGSGGCICSWPCCWGGPAGERGVSVCSVPPSPTPAGPTCWRRAGAWVGIQWVGASPSPGSNPTMPGPADPPSVGLPRPPRSPPGLSSPSRRSAGAGGRACPASPPPPPSSHRQHPPALPLRCCPPPAPQLRGGPVPAVHPLPAAAALPSWQVVSSQHVTCGRALLLPTPGVRARLPAPENLP